MTLTNIKIKKGGEVRGRQGRPSLQCKEPGRRLERSSGREAPPEPGLPRPDFAQQRHPKKISRSSRS